ncbi:MAG TPA: GAF domain-containing protein [Usitatibacter sp.]|nr:GAF domain-containing protein [Usitatibacter sp.]
MTLVHTIDDDVERARSMIRDGAAAREILTYLATVAEQHVRPGAAASILVLDDEGLLRNGASPNIPADYLDAIDRLRPNANLGTCAAAAATGQIVITDDFMSDEKWAELRHLPLSLGYAGAWSNPIKNEHGRVLGTFGIYHRERGKPSTAERHVVGQLATVAAQAIAKRR